MFKKGDIVVIEEVGEESAFYGDKLEGSIIQLQTPLAFGYANLNDNEMAEWGYISIRELRENGAYNVPHWKPKIFSDIER